MVLIPGKTPYDLIKKIDEWQNGSTHGGYRNIVQFSVQWVGGDGWVAFILFEYTLREHMDTYELPAELGRSIDWSFDHREKTWTVLPKTGSR